jgi:hypothetical protein
MRARSNPRDAARRCQRGSGNVESPARNFSCRTTLRHSLAEITESEVYRESYLSQPLVYSNGLTKHFWAALACGVVKLLNYAREQNNVTLQRQGGNSVGKRVLDRTCFEVLESNRTYTYFALNSGVRYNK